MKDSPGESRRDVLKMGVAAGAGMLGGVAGSEITRRLSSQEEASPKPVEYERFGEITSLEPEVASILERKKDRILFNAKTGALETRNESGERLRYYYPRDAQQIEQIYGRLSRGGSNLIFEYHYKNNSTETLYVRYNFRSDSFEIVEGQGKVTVPQQRDI